MPKAPRRCPSPGCTALIKHTTYCEDHTEAWATPSGWRRPRNWESDREHVLERDNWTCHICGRPGADTVDHLTPQSQGGRDHRDNYGAVHDRTPPHCHRDKTNQEKVKPTGRRSLR